MPDKRILNFLIIVLLSIATFWWTFFIFHVTFDWKLVSTVVFFRILASVLIFEDYSLSWSKVTQKTFLIKTIVAFVPLLFYIPLFYGEVRIAVMLNEFFTYLVATNFLMYLYYYYTNQTGIAKTKSLVIYGAGKAGNKLESEYRGSEYRIKYFIDDDKVLQGRSIDGIKVVSKEHLIDIVSKERKYELLVIAATNASSQRIKEIHENLSPYFAQIKILPTTEKILVEQSYSKMLQDISIEDLLARRPKDLDKAVIQNFIKGKKVLITGAGGSIGSEISRQCALYGASQLLLLDHSEYNLYTIHQALEPIAAAESVDGTAGVRLRLGLPDRAADQRQLVHAARARQGARRLLVAQFVHRVLAARRGHELVGEQVRRHRLERCLPLAGLEATGDQRGRRPRRPAPR